MLIFPLMGSEFDYPAGEHYDPASELHISSFAIAIVERQVKEEKEVEYLIAVLGFRSTIVPSTIKNFERFLALISAESAIQGKPLSAKERVAKMRDLDYKELADEFNSAGLKEAVTPESIALLVDESITHFSDNLESASLGQELQDHIPKMIDGSKRIAERKGVSAEEVFRDDGLYSDLIRETFSPKQYSEFIIKTFGLTINPDYVSEITRSLLREKYGELDKTVIERMTLEMTQSDEFKVFYEEAKDRMKTISNSVTFNLVANHWGIGVALIELHPDAFPKPGGTIRY